MSLDWSAAAKVLVLSSSLLLGSCQSTASIGPKLNVSLDFSVEDQTLTLRIENESARKAYFYPGLFKRQGFIENVFLLFRSFGDDPQCGISHPVWSSSDALVRTPVRMDRMRGQETKQISGSFEEMLGFMDWAKENGFADGVAVRFDAVIYTDDRLIHSLRATTPWFRLRNRRLVALTSVEQAELPESTDSQWKAYRDSLTQLR